jgi:hypothetical protein
MPKGGRRPVHASFAFAQYSSFQGFGLGRFGDANHIPIRTNRDIQPKRLTTKWAKFEVGDEVMVECDPDSSTPCISGTIEEVRGGGWYTLCLSDDAIRVKKRGSQLQKKDFVQALADEYNASSEILEEAPLPNVQIIDLDSVLHHSLINNVDDVLKNSEVIEQLNSCHTKCRRWIIFSDLHVMPSTLTTCIQVLDFVHNTAIKRQAGILFLGDFWHHRGFVRVDCLNAVLETMSKWKVPSIMIPGKLFCVACEM